MAGFPAGTAKIHQLAVSPPAISFAGSDPDAGSVAASQPAVVIFRISGGDASREWSLSVSAASPFFLNCGTVPASAVSVRCQSAGVSPPDGTAECAPPFRLSSTPQRIAGGRQGGRGVQQYLITVTFSFSESWGYVAQIAPPCMLSLNYAAEAQ